jgi:hypothetical protein
MFRVCSLVALTMSDMPARGPVVLTEDEVEALLDLMGPPNADDDPIKVNLRSKLSLLLKVADSFVNHFMLQELRSGAVPSMMDGFYQAKKEEVK